jgi:hypothetical protein
MTQEDLNLAALRAEQMVLAEFTLESRFSPPSGSIDPNLERGLDRPSSVSPTHGGHSGLRSQPLIAGALKQDEAFLGRVQEFHFFLLR